LRKIKKYKDQEFQELNGVSGYTFKKMIEILEGALKTRKKRQ